MRSGLGRCRIRLALSQNMKYRRLFYRLSGTFREANPGIERYAIRINPNRSGEETVLRILQESCEEVQ
jgi:hypothetical protein